MSLKLSLLTFTFRYKRITYEKLCEAPEAVIKDIYQFIKKTPPQGVLDWFQVFRQFSFFTHLSSRFNREAWKVHCSADF